MSKPVFFISDLGVASSKAGGLNKQTKMEWQYYEIYLHSICSELLTELLEENKIGYV